MFAEITEKSTEKSAAPLPESASASAFIFRKCEHDQERVLSLASEREHERVRHFEERANALKNGKTLKLEVKRKSVKIKEASQFAN